MSSDGTEGETGPFAARRDGRCPICRAESKNLVQDHDHHSGMKRSRICRSCNRKLAYAESFVHALDRDRWAKSHRRLTNYLDWWESHPSVEGYTGGRWTKGVFFDGTARETIRTDLLALRARGLHPWTGSVYRRAESPRLTLAELSRPTEEIGRRRLGGNTPVARRYFRLRRVTSPEEAERVLELYSAGKTYRAIRRDLGLGISTISRIIRSAHESPGSSVEVSLKGRPR